LVWLPPKETGMNVAGEEVLFLLQSPVQNH